MARYAGITPSNNHPPLTTPHPHYLRPVKFILSSIAIFLSLMGAAQFQVRDSMLFNPHISVSMAYQTPAGDMADRFGNSGSPGVGFHIKSKTNWYYGIKGIYFFGNKVNERGLLGNLRTQSGEILDNQGQISILYIQERGYAISLEGGRLFNFIGANPNSGLLLTGGVGFLQHKIRIEHQTNEITQLEDEYLKGYDRLTNGLALNQFIGYYHMGTNRLVNFWIGIESYQGFTQSRRDFNFDTRTTDTTKRLDVLFGLRAGWFINLYRRYADQYYFN